MAKEIECKVSLKNHELFRVFHAISHEFPSFSRERINKYDQYYDTEDKQRLFRIRHLSHSVVLTRKAKEVREDSFECNEEVECVLPTSEYRNLQKFFTSLGFHIVQEKRKRGWKWAQDTLTIELVYVHALGWFIELELLLDDTATEDETALATEKLTHILQQVGVAHLPLEKRYYIDMLSEIGGKIWK